MSTTLPIPIERLITRRKDLGMTYAVLATRSGISEPTVKRILGGHHAQASLANVIAVAQALGMTLDFQTQTQVDDLCRQQAQQQAQHIATLVQGTSALESQAVDPQTYNRIVEKSYHELMAGSKRKLWGN